MNSKVSRRQFTRSAGIAAVGLLCGCSIRNRFHILIKNGTLLNGSGSPSVTGDLGIIDDKIAAIGDLTDATSDLTIDATGKIVCPGFIDIHSHTDIELLVNPTADSKVQQGVTTEISGNCGSTPFPFTDADFSVFDQALYERHGIHASWKNISDFLTALEKNKISINYATYTGHGDLRAYVMGKNDVPPTSDQLETMKRVLADSMENGSFGLSSGLEYAPGSYAATEELIELNKVISKYNGVYATHMRNEDDHVEEAIEESLRICREAAVSTELAHLKACNQANWHKVDHMLEMIHRAAENGLPVAADRYPYIAYGTTLSRFLPLWAVQGNTDEIMARLKDNRLNPQLEQYAEGRGERIGGWDRVVISSCRTEENRRWIGQSVRAGSEATNVSPFEFIRRLLIAEENSVGIVGFAMNEDNLKKVLSSPLVMVGSDGNAVAPTGKLGTGRPHPRYYGTFPRVLGKYCREEKVLDFATAVKKMTSMPALKMGIKDRGILLKGYYADITIFNPHTVMDQATFTQPHQFPLGIDYVIVNGKITIQNGIHKGQMAGMVLRHHRA